MVIIFWPAWANYGVHELVEWARQHGGIIVARGRYLRLVQTEGDQK